MARIKTPSVKESGWLLRLVQWSFRRKYGKSFETASVMGLSTRVLLGAGMFDMAVQGCKRVDARTIELAQLKVATLIGCPFCIDLGARIVTESGVGEEQLRELHRHSASEAFSRREKAVLDYSVEVTNTPVQVSPEVFSELRNHYDDAQIVELTAAIGWENWRARFTHAAGVESAGFMENAYCPLPERG